MSNLEQIDLLLNYFIKNTPTLSNGKEMLETNVASIENVFNFDSYRATLEISYHQFEEWLNNLLDKEKPQEDIIAINFGLYETENSIQLYICGSNEWHSDDESWASNNDYFPEDTYQSITLYENLYRVLENNLVLGTFLTIASTIMFVNTYVLNNPGKFAKDVALATGFDDGDLYNFNKVK